MLIKKLELSGFKSFMNPVTLDFGGGITAILGPNGCGKSNVVDALRWVLGEQSAKQLRGERMTNVVFGGTRPRKPLGMAEVAVTFSDLDGRMATPYQEVCLTRRLTREGAATLIRPSACTSCMVKNACGIRRSANAGSPPSARAQPRRVRAPWWISCSSDFLTDAFGDMFNQMSKLQWMSGGRLKMPIVLRGGVGVAPSNATHHSGNYYPLFMHLPGFRVVLPTTPTDAKGLLKTSIRSDDPVLCLEHKNLLNLKGPVPDGEHLVPFGKAAIAREGKDVTVLRYTRSGWQR